MPACCWDSKQSTSALLVRINRVLLLCSSAGLHKPQEGGTASSLRNGRRTPPPRTYYHPQHLTGKRHHQEPGGRQGLVRDATASTRTGCRLPSLELVEASECIYSYSARAWRRGGWLTGQRLHPRQQVLMSRNLWPAPTPRQFAIPLLCKRLRSSGSSAQDSTDVAQNSCKTSMLCLAF